MICACWRERFGGSNISAHSIDCRRFVLNEARAEPVFGGADDRVFYRQSLFRAQAALARTDLYCKRIRPLRGPNQTLDLVAGYVALIRGSRLIETQGKGLPKGALLIQFTAMNIGVLVLN